MRRMALEMSVALVVALLVSSATPGAQGAGMTVSVDQMSPGQQVDFALNAGNAGKTATATANPQGQASSILDFANAPKPQMQVDVYTFTCPPPPDPGRVVVKMVPSGSPAPDDPCGNRKMVGAFWLHKARHVTIHLKTGTMDVDEGNRTMRWGLIGGGAAVLVAIIATKGGSDSSAGVSTPAPVTPTPTPTPTPSPTPTPTPTPTFDPNGTYRGSLRVIADPAGHDPFTRYSTVTSLVVSVSGSTITITGPAPWVTVSGTYNSATGSFSATGTGTVAGFNNVPVTVTGTIATTGQMTITQVQLGPTNLPTNQAEVLAGTFQKQ